MTIDEAIANYQGISNYLQRYHVPDEEVQLQITNAKCIEWFTEVAEWLRELKETKRLVTQLKAKLCDFSEYCAYCDELDMSERGYFTCKFKKKKIPAVCYWQVLTPAYFDDIPWTKGDSENAE